VDARPRSHPRHCTWPVRSWRRPHSGCPFHTARTQAGCPPRDCSTARPNTSWRRMRGQMLKTMNRWNREISPSIGSNVHRVIINIDDVCRMPKNRLCEFTGISFGFMPAFCVLNSSFSHANQALCLPLSSGFDPFHLHPPHTPAEIVCFLHPPRQ